MPHWRKLLLQVVEYVPFFAFDNAGSNRLARIAMIAITTRSSISVKPVNRRRFRGMLTFGIISRISLPQQGAIGDA